MHIHEFAFALLLCPVLAAQGTTVGIVTDTPLTAASTLAGSTTLEGVPSGLVWSSSNRISFSTSQNTGGFVHASTTVFPTQPYNGGISVNFWERAAVRGATTDIAGSSASTAVAGLTFGPHAILCTFNAAPGTVGNIVLGFRASTAPTGTTGVVVDVDNDGTIELQSAVSASQRIPYTFGPGGSVVVRVSNECYSTGDGNSGWMYSWTEANVGFFPDLTATCTFMNYGTSCGPMAAGSEAVIGSNRVITMLVTGCFPNAPVIAVAGTQQANLSLPGGCSLLANAANLSIISADGAGNASESWVVPVTAVGTSWHQFVPVDLQNGALVISASDGVRVDCVR